MSKRHREHEDQDDVSKLDPAVQAVINGYEGNLAQFMDSLSSLLERYNTLLQDALPHNPKAVFYYQQSQDEANDKAAAEGAASETTPGAVSADATPAPGKADADHAFPAVALHETAVRRAPTSPLLRRPQLPAQQLEELKLEAKAELERRTSTFAFPTAAELAQRSPDLKAKSHPHASSSRQGSKARSRSVDATSVTAAPTHDTPAAKDATDNADSVVADSLPVNVNGSSTQAPFTPNPLGIRTTYNKVMDKKAIKELAKKAAEEINTITAKEAQEKQAAEGAAATGTDATPEAKTDDTPNKVESCILKITNQMCTRTVAEVLKDVEMPPMLLAQLRNLKKESQSLMYTFDQIHDWIAMKAPAMNESDNQGVAIMASVISVISSIMSTLQDLYDMEKDYINKRSQLECQYVPNFECSTIRELIAATDANKWDDIEVGWRTMMRAVIIVHSRLAANMKTLRTPREKRVHLSM